LGGNSLLECTVYGTIVGKKLPIQKSPRIKQPAQSVDQAAAKPTKLRNVPKSQLQQHNTPEDCWVAIHGIVYDLTDFAKKHPAGAQPIHMLAGRDGTSVFAVIHNERQLEKFDKEIVGVYAG
jgi:cytochrome b involved in lipid metabolism